MPLIHVGIAIRPRGQIKSRLRAESPDETVVACCRKASAGLVAIPGAARARADRLVVGRDVHRGHTVVVTRLVVGRDVNGCRALVETVERVAGWTTDRGRIAHDFRGGGAVDPIHRALGGRDTRVVAVHRTLQRIEIGVDLVCVGGRTVGEVVWH